MRIPADNSVKPPTLDCYVEARDSFFGDPTSELAALLIEHVRESRQSYFEQTLAEEQHLRVVQAAQVEDLRKEADKVRDAGMAKGFGLIAGGLLTIGSGLATAKDTGVNTEAGANTDPAPKAPPKADAPVNWATELAGGAKAAEGAGEVGAAHFERQAGLKRADATEHEHLAGEAERRLETLEEARNHARELERSAFEHLKNMQDKRAETDRMITSWRG